MLNFVRRICNRVDSRTQEVADDLALTLDAQYAASCLHAAAPADARGLPFALFAYHAPKNATMNVGDAIQTLAVRNALEQIGVTDFADECLVRDELSLYRGRPVRCVMQAWFSETRLFWPSPWVRPVFVGMHLTVPTQRFVSRLLAYAPEIRRSHEFGCRDQATLAYCRSEGLSAYLSRCLTLTLPRRATAPTDGKVFFVDVPEEYLRHFPAELAKKGISFTQRALRSDLVSTGYSPSAQLELGKAYLARYRDEASLVVTTAIHVAMPCVAMGIPVCFLEGPATRDPTRNSALEGIVPINTRADLAAGKVDFDPAPMDVSGLKELLLENLRLSISRASGEDVNEKRVEEVRKAIAAAEGVKEVK